jgi:uncharacterized membrane protein YGL010W
MSSSSSPASRYGALLQGFAFYGAYHSNTINQLIHAAFVPTIVGSALALLTGARVPLPPLPAPLPAAVSAAALAAPALAAYYLQLSARSGLPLVGLGAGAGVLALWAGAEALVARGGGFAATWRPALALHLVAWVAQFVGHGAFEGRAPALLDNLFDALVMAPLFVFIEGIFWCGGLKSFRKAAEAEIATRRASFLARSR